MHFYTKNGEPMHTLIGSNGKERSTSIADARKLGLLPSVTTIMDVQSKPALIIWLQQQLLKAAIETPYRSDIWHEEDWCKAMLTQMRSVGKKAADRGTEIHGYLDAYYSGGQDADDLVGLPAEQWPYIAPAIKLIRDTFGNGGWVSEASFANLEHGFAGCVDLHHPEKKIIIDFKTKDKLDLKGVKQYDDHHTQLAAYQLGLGMPSDTRRFNLFISTSEESPGQCLLLESKEYGRPLDMFNALLKLWQAKNKYNPGKFHQYEGE